MTSELEPTRPADLIRALEREGWVIDQVRGKHIILRNSNAPNVLTVLTETRTVGRKSLQGIIASAGISADRFIELLQG